MTKTHTVVAIEPPTPEHIKALRVSANLSLKETAAMFGYSLRAWQRKEESGSTNTKLSVGEFQLLLLLAGEHPEFKLTRT